MRKTTAFILVALVASGLVGMGSAGSGSERSSGPERRYVVLFEEGADIEEAAGALRSFGARIARLNSAVGLATVRSSHPDFSSEAMSSGYVAGVARDRSIGRNPQEVLKPSIVPQPRPERPVPGRLRPRRTGDQPGEDPLFRFQWNMRLLNAGPSDSYRIDEGDERVLVGIIDTGIGSRHPDIGNFDADLSRNFTRDIPRVDGPCKKEPDKSCEDSALIDEGGHGTWVATTVAGAHDGFGISGVAPDVTLVNLRAGQDSGYFFLQPTVDALTYAADNGIDVVNMSFFIDPWLYNCADNPADSPSDQMEQRTIIEATRRAVDYARERNVTLIAAIGNEWTDLGKPEVDVISPDFPPGASYERQVDNSCLVMPTEAEGVIAVSGVGPSGRKSWLSSYGLEQTHVAAPSGDSFDETLRYPRNMVLSAFTKPGLRAFGLIDREGRPNGPEVLKRCVTRRRCGYYLFGEGTSIASPAATGVAALIVGAFGTDDGAGGLTMDPALVEEMLEGSATPHDCPPDGVQEYPEIGDAFEDSGLDAEDFTATCEESGGGVNGFYGHGIVDALQALEG